MTPEYILALIPLAGLSGLVIGWHACSRILHRRRLHSPILKALDKVEEQVEPLPLWALEHCRDALTWTMELGTQDRMMALQEIKKRLKAIHEEQGS